VAGGAGGGGGGPPPAWPVHLKTRLFFFPILANGMRQIAVSPFQDSASVLPGLGAELLRMYCGRSGGASKRPVRLPPKFNPLHRRPARGHPAGGPGHGLPGVGGPPHFEYTALAAKDFPAPRFELLAYAGLLDRPFG